MIYILWTVSRGHGDRPARGQPRTRPIAGERSRSSSAAALPGAMPGPAVSAQPTPSHGGHFAGAAGGGPIGVNCGCYGTRLGVDRL